MLTRTLVRGALALAVTFTAGGATPVLAQAAATAYNVPVTYYTLPNGLKVVLSRDTTVPTVGVGVYYHVGFRK